MWNPETSTISRIAYVSLACALLYAYALGNPGLDQGLFVYSFGAGSLVFFAWTYLVFRKRHREVLARYPEYLPSDRSSRPLGRYGIIASLAGFLLAFGTMVLAGTPSLGSVVAVVLFFMVLFAGLVSIMYRMWIVMTQIMRASLRKP